MKLKWKAAGSNISTCRMLTRMAGFNVNLMYFVGKLVAYTKGNLKLKSESKIEWLINVIDFWSGIFDNLVYFNRVNLRKWTTKWQELWIDWLSSACCVAVILLSMVQKFLKIYYKSIKDLNSVENVF
jgi:hypothetical protein